MPIKKSVKICDLHIPENYSLGKVGCTQSLACKFKQCPRQFLFAINRWHSKTGQEKSAIGNIVHAVLSIIYKKGDPSTFLHNLQVEINKEIDFTNKEKYCFINRQQMDYFKTVAHCVIMNYIKFYANDFKLAFFTEIEKEFAVIINGILWRGKRDGEHIVKKDKSLWIREIKNRSRINECNIMQGLQFDFQSNLYCVSRDSGKEITSGFIYDMIRTPQSKPKKDETMASFFQRLNDDIESRPEYYFMRFEVPLTNIDKKDFNEELYYLNKYMISYLQTTLFIYNIKNSFSCIDGTFVCEYLDACTTGNLNNYYQSKKIFNELDCGY